MPLRLPLLVLACLGLLGACSVITSTDESELALPEDAGRDGANADARAQLDGAADASPEAGGRDAAADGQAVDSAVPDADSTVAVDRRGVLCGAERCDGTSFCCVTDSPGAACAGGGTGIACDCRPPGRCSVVELRCDGPEDCGSGERCCATGFDGEDTPSEVRCQRNCGGSGGGVWRAQMCHPTDANTCPTGTRCGAHLLFNTPYGRCE